MLPNLSLASHSRFFTISVPVISDPTAASLEAAIRAAMIAASIGAPQIEMLISQIVGFNIVGKVAAGTDRIALHIGDNATTQLRYVGAGVDYCPPTLTDARQLYIAGATAATDIIIELFLR